MEKRYSLAFSVDGKIVGVSITLQDFNITPVIDDYIKTFLQKEGVKEVFLASLHLTVNQ